MSAWSPIQKELKYKQLIRIYTLVYSAVHIHVILYRIGFILLRYTRTVCRMQRTQLFKQYIHVIHTHSVYIIYPARVSPVSTAYSSQVYTSQSVLSPVRPAFVFHGTNVLKRAICFYLNKQTDGVSGEQKCQRLANRIYFCMSRQTARCYTHAYTTKL